MQKHQTIFLISILALMAAGSYKAFWSTQNVVVKAETRRPVTNPAGVEQARALEARYNRAVQLSGRGDWVAAEKELNYVIKEEPNHVFAYAELGKAYEALGRPNEARIAYAEALKTTPGRVSSLSSDPRILVRYGEVCQKTGKVSDAVRAYAGAVAGEYDSTSTTPMPRGQTMVSLRKGANGQAAIRCQMHGDYKGAEYHMRKILTLEPTNWKARAELAKLIYKQGRDGEAKTEMLRAKKDAGSQSSSLKTAGEAIGLPTEHKYYIMVGGKSYESRTPK